MAWEGERTQDTQKLEKITELFMLTQRYCDITKVPQKRNLHPRTHAHRVRTGTTCGCVHT